MPARETNRAMRAVVVTVADRLQSWLFHGAVVASTVTLLMALAGCESVPSWLGGGGAAAGSPADRQPMAGAGVEAELESQTNDGFAAGSSTVIDDPMAAAAEAYARQVEAGLAALDRTTRDQVAASHGVDGMDSVDRVDGAPRVEPDPPQVRWLDDSSTAATSSHANASRAGDVMTPSAQALRRAARLTATGAGFDDGDATAAATETPKAVSASAPGKATVPAASEVRKPEAMGRRELIAALAAQLARESGTETDKVRRIAALSLLDADGTVREASLAGMDAATAETARRYARLMHVLSDDLDHGRMPNREVLASQLAEVFGPSELRIKRFELCRRVQSYGVFDPIASRVLLVGKPHRLGLYLEVENFASSEFAPGQFEVKLRQEVELFNAADGLAVWKQPAVAIVDQSRNQRRDFFTWQVVELPTRLTVGRYILKVRVTDAHAGMVSEEALELQIVADPALARVATQP